MEPFRAAEQEVEQGCGEADGGSNDLWFGSHAHGADRGFYPCAARSRARTGLLAHDQDSADRKSKNATVSEGDLCRAALTTHAEDC